MDVVPLKVCNLSLLMSIVYVTCSLKIHFLVEIVLTKEIKESLHLFDDVFEFFQLAGLPNNERYADPSNLEKFDWKELEDFLPLNVTTATDMTQHFSSFQSTS
jgi:hypothetical protein